MSHTLCTLAWLATAFAGPVSDPTKPFEAGWDKPVDPDGDCKFRRERGTLTIEVPGTDHDLGIERGRMNAPRLLQDVEGDFVVRVRVGGKFVPAINSTTTERLSFVGAGLVLMAGEKTYLRLERAALHSMGAVKHYANWESRKDGQWVRRGNASVCPLEDKETYLRLGRKGDKITAAVSQDGEKWTELPALEMKLPAKLKLGVAAVTTSAGPFSPRFDRYTVEKGKERD